MKLRKHNNRTDNQLSAYLPKARGLKLRSAVFSPTGIDNKAQGRASAPWVYFVNAPTLKGLDNRAGRVILPRWGMFLEMVPRVR
jgi:hypothetical protein